MNNLNKEKWSWKPWENGDWYEVHWDIIGIGVSFNWCLEFRGFSFQIGPLWVSIGMYFHEDLADVELN